MKIPNSEINYYKVGNYFSVGIIIALLSQTFFRLYPFEELTPGISNNIDDWFRYWDNAIDISKNGILMPSQANEYYGPGSFLYNYFIAICFLIFGQNVIPIYFIHSLLLGFSILIFYYTFRNKLSGLIGFLLLLTLFGFAVFDFYKYYTFRLLSENLAVFVVACFVYFIIKATEKINLKAIYFASFFLVLALLIRPTLLPLTVLYLVFLVYFFYKNKALKKSHLLFILFLIIAGFNTLGLRNFIVAGNWEILPTEGKSDAFSQLIHLDLQLIYKKIMFAFGYMPILNENYSSRPHWMILWLFYVFYVVKRCLFIKSISSSELFLNLFLLFFYALNILFVTIDSYGFRAFLPLQFLLISLSFLTIDQFFQFFKKEEIV